MCEQVVKLLIEDELVRELSPRRTRGSTLQQKPAPKASTTRGGCGSRIILTPSISLSCVSTHNTLPSLHADRGSREASFPTSIPLSSNYFDVLSEEEDAPPQGTLERERRFPELHRALAFSRDPKQKASMSLHAHEMEAEEADLHFALHLSRVEAQKSGHEETPPCQQKDATGRTWSSIAGPTTSRADGSTTRRIPPSPMQRYPTLPTSSRNRSLAALPPHPEMKLKVAKKTLPRSLVP
jgi:hypothetical protein